MNEKGKSRLIGIVLFWVAAIVPFFVIFMIKDLLEGFWFVNLLFIYFLIYRPILHIFRLLQLKVIEKKDAWKLFIPFNDAK
jgi:hypothetical protein